VSTEYMKQNLRRSYLYIYKELAFFIINN
jgi:hypothetical protein